MLRGEGMPPYHTTCFSLGFLSKLSCHWMSTRLIVRGTRQQWKYSQLWDWNHKLKKRRKRKERRTRRRKILLLRRPALEKENPSLLKRARKKVKRKDRSLSPIPEERKKSKRRIMRLLRRSPLPPLKLKMRSLQLVQTLLQHMLADLLLKLLDQLREESW